MPSLTIVIPCREKTFTLVGAIQTVEGQTVDTQHIVQKDTEHEGAGLTRNKAIQNVLTEWVGFLDDDDRLDPHYHEWLNEECSDYDMVIFKMKVGPQELIPKTNRVEDLNFGDVGISFALKTELAKQFPFVKENRNKGLHEDWEMVRALRDKGYKIKISEHITYYVRGN